ncbi:hypothetical protein [Methylocapsa acidiphila]|uniref:hypothetical protein n=1 Tax=Methylocapsa acidiphila TaxID=133552 RepID=UPI00056C37CC|nr:hypothetical protein [Methylocapsa acidiphila]
MARAADQAQSERAAGPDLRLRLPPIAVRTEAERVARFRQETDAAAIEGLVPLAFPVCWLASPEIRLALSRAIGEGVLPVHEAQSFAFERRLEIDADYVIEAELLRKDDPPGVHLHAVVLTPEGEACGRLEAVLRLAPIAMRSSS